MGDGMTMQDPRHVDHMAGHVAGRMGLPECSRIAFMGHPWTMPLRASQIVVLRHFAGEIHRSGGMGPGRMSGRPMKGGSAPAFGRHLQPPGLSRRWAISIPPSDSTSVQAPCTGATKSCEPDRHVLLDGGIWWRWRDSNPRPPRCERGALPAEPHPHLAIIYFILSLRSRVLMKARRSSLTSGCCSPR
jgi:hypothetical protein